MAIDRTTFLAEFPEFSVVPGSAVDRRLAQATATLKPSRLGVWYEDLCFLWSAHYLFTRFDISAGLDANSLNEMENQGVTTAQAASTTGLSSSTSVSQLVQSENPVLADFSLTKYGMMYMSLLRQVVAPMVICG